MRIPLTLLIVAALLGSAGAALAQDQSPDAEGRITGHVVSAEGEEPLEGATVGVRDPSDSTLVTGTVTDDDGTFAIDNVPFGEHVVRVSFVGFETVHIADVRLTRDDPARDLGTIRLAESTEQLDEVEVTDERVATEMQIDRTVYNTADQPVTAGGSAQDVLQDLPSIEVDFDGSISFRGNENVVIHINGQPSTLSGDALASFLQSLPADAVERVEVIPNPSARYEPDGMAGIINIVLQENRAAGWSGGITAGAGTNSSYNASGNAGYRSGPWRVFTTYGFRYGARDASGYRLRENRMENPTTVLDQSSTEDDTRQSHTLNTQVEYTLSDATSLSLESIFSLRSSAEDERTNYTERTTNGTMLDRYARIIENDESDLGVDGRLTLQHDFADEGHELSAELEYERDREDEGGTYTQRALTSDGDLSDVRRRERDDLDEYEQEGSLEIDYTRPLGRLDLEAGYRGSLERLDSDQHFEVFDDGAYRTEEINAFTFDEQIHAGYGILSTELGPFGLETGLRAEQALTTFELDVTGEAFDNNYFSLFPSAFVTYEASEARQMRLSYSKRINRPNTWQLNPLDDNQDPNSQFIGNPRLDPEYVHAFELSFVQHWDALSVTASPFFRRTVNEIEFHETLDEDGVTTVTFENVASSDSYGIELITSLQMQDWVRGNITLNAYRVVTDGSNVDTDLSRNAMAYSGRANLTFSLTPGLDLQLSQFYRAPMDIAGGRMGRRLRSDVALQQELFDGQANVSLRARDVFDTMGFDIWRNTDAFYTESSRNWNAQQVMVTFSYNFGQQSQRDRQRDGRGGEPEGDFEEGGYQQ